ncbi:MAG: hypothetical protein K0U74_02855 [Alphaproteobacteria bacterium]|nr:hypothetical protein [Alphaproteobacteria bacterium]
MYHGLLDGRDAHRTYVGFSYAKLADGIAQVAEDAFHGPAIVPNQPYEAILEVGHVFQGTPFWAVAPAVE